MPSIIFLKKIVRQYFGPNRKKFKFVYTFPYHETDFKIVITDHYFCGQTSNDIDDIILSSIKYLDKHACGAIKHNLLS